VIVAWGGNTYGQCNVPAPNADFVAVAAGWQHSLGLKSDGTIVAWGWNASGQCNVPAPNADFVAVVGGYGHSLGLKSGGTIVAWGLNNFGQCDIPPANSDFVAAAAGDNHGLGLKSDGTIVAWGLNNSGQCDVPAPNTDFLAISAGRERSLGLKNLPFTAVEDPQPGDAPAAAGLAIFSLAPNPFHPSTEISFDVRVPGPVTMEIYDGSGRRVRTVPVQVSGTGSNRARWDGRDASGTRVAPGTYFIRLHGVKAESPAVKSILIR
jgi:hypothetical protein